LEYAITTNQSAELEDKDVKSCVLSQDSSKTGFSVLVLKVGVLPTPLLEDRLLCEYAI